MLSELSIIASQEGCKLVGWYLSLTSDYSYEHIKRGASDGTGEANAAHLSCALLYIYLVKGDNLTSKN